MMKAIGLDPKLAVRILFGAVDEILSEWLLSGEKKPIADARQLVGTLLSGFAGGEERFASKGKSAAGSDVSRRRTTTRRGSSEISSKVSGAQRPAKANERDSPFEARGEAANTVTRTSSRVFGRRSRPL